MRDRLPPLFSLQAFEAAARLGNFSRAAAELKLTPGAVSRQIRQLEDWCALTLFERRGPQVRLTRDGQELLGRLGAPLTALHEAVYPSADAAAQTLQIETLASTAKAWLLPRLPDFVARHPQVALIVQTDYALIRPPPRVPMVALRHGAQPAGDELASERLFEDRLLAVAARAGCRPSTRISGAGRHAPGCSTSAWTAARGSTPPGCPRTSRPPARPSTTPTSRSMPRSTASASR
ncbi:LysR family transcriptional regulator [Aquincola sp. S2]|uniref:LysR family transcriptional regulator n=1 Tax=Pseudaquabacterium terrae TaxID=2732868 RepID=A0ABX2EP19_9BURK|nr:LysR family transcriptional regulator [Aquabacterium terrae]NRF70318.1 LysR family transcriptional regulator [Aquabacterium terrae]